MEHAVLGTCYQVKILETGEIVRSEMEKEEMASLLSRSGKTGNAKAINGKDEESENAPEPRATASEQSSSSSSDSSSSSSSKGNKKAKQKRAKTKKARKLAKKAHELEMK